MATSSLRPICPIEELPAELLYAILSHVPRQGLPNVRLANKTLAAAGAPHLFQTLSVWLGLRSLENFKCIAQHPHLAQYVKSLIFSPISFFEGTDEEEVIRNLRDLDGGVMISERRVAAYRSFVDTQQILSSNGMELAILTTGMRQMQHLSSLAVDVRDVSIGFNELTSLIGPLWNDTIMIYDYEHLLPIILRAWKESSASIQHFRFGRHIQFPQPKNIRQPRNMEMSFWKWISDDFMDCRGHFHPRSLRNMFDDIDYRSSEGPFARLQKLEIANLVIFPHDADSELPDAFKGLQHLLSTSSALTEIRIDTIEDGMKYESLPLTTLFGPVVIPHLQNLHLTSHFTYLADLVDIIHTHAPTLVNVHLAENVLYDSDEILLLSKVRQATFPRLQRFVLQWEDQNGHFFEVQDYILGRTEINPVLEWYKELRHQHRLRKHE